MGAATCLELARRRPRARILLLEKESQAACHQTGHNSGVVHAGVYYEPGSLKAEFCRKGVEDTRHFCREHGIPYRTTGKLLVAADERELGRMGDLFDRCRENGLAPTGLSASQLQELEPAVRGAGAFLVRESGITDFPAICRAMLKEFQSRGGEIRFALEVSAIVEHADQVTVKAGGQAFRAVQLTVCGGLQADRLARLQGLNIGFRVLPFRGEYYVLKPAMSKLVRHLIYPIPDPALPFLGVHITPTVDGVIKVGPNAVQGWKREGYRTVNISLRDTVENLSWPGFWKLSARHARQGLKEMRNSLWKRGYLALVRRYCPQIGLDDLLPSPAGIRAQAVLKDGTMVHDFLLQETARTLHVCNAPSPAATSAIPISRYICDRLVN